MKYKILCLHITEAGFKDAIEKQRHLIFIRALIVSMRNMRNEIENNSIVQFETGETTEKRKPIHEDTLHKEKKKSNRLTYFRISRFDMHTSISAQNEETSSK